MHDFTQDEIAAALAEIRQAGPKTRKCSDLANDVGRSLLQAQLNTGTSMREVERGCGVSSAVLGRWLKGERRGINAGTLCPLVDYLTESTPAWVAPGAANLIDSITGRILFGDGHISRLELKQAGAILRSEHVSHL